MGPPARLQEPRVPFGVSVRVAIGAGVDLGHFVFADLHQSPGRVGQLRVGGIEDDTVVEDPSKVGQEGPRRRVAFLFDVAL